MVMAAMAPSLTASTQAVPVGAVEVVAPPVVGKVREAWWVAGFVAVLYGSYIAG